MKKVFALLLGAVMLLSLPLAAHAAEETGSITIENPVDQQTYAVYRIFDLVSYDADKAAYSYSVNADWKAFAEQNSVNGVYINLETVGAVTYVHWVDGADEKAFARLAIEWARANARAAAAQLNAQAGQTLVFQNLPLGYYLIDSSVGALCALTTTSPNATVREKNELTTVTKLVKEDSSGEYGSRNHAQVGDTVSFKSDITLGAGTEKLVLHDRMDPSLNLNADSFSLMHGADIIAAEYYTVKTSGLNDDCTFEIHFKDDYIAGLVKGSVITVSYTAVLNTMASISTETNDNTTWVSFGDSLTSVTSTTHTETYQFILVKTDADGKILSGAEFYLYDAAEDGNIIPVIALMEDAEHGIFEYRVAAAGEVTDGKGSTIRAGIASVSGLDGAVYFLEEAKAPAGYNRLTARAQVDMTNGNISFTQDYENWGTVYGIPVTADMGGVQVINRAGIQLPSTGGAGTTMIYAFGALLIVSSLAILTLKKEKEKRS